jgi:hypothetical protein
MGLAVAVAVPEANAADGDDQWIVCTQEYKIRVMPPVAQGTEVAPGTTLVGAGDQSQPVVSADGGVYGLGEATWLVDGSPSQAGAKFTVRKRHLGAQITQAMILKFAPKPGETIACPPTLGFTPTVVVKAVGKVTAKPAASSVAAGTRLGVSVKVKADGVPEPAGKIRVAVDGTHALTKALNPSAKGSLQVKLPQLAKGKHKVTISYVDTTGKIQNAKATAFTVRVK